MVNPHSTLMIVGGAYNVNTISPGGAGLMSGGNSHIIHMGGGGANVIRHQNSNARGGGGHQRVGSGENHARNLIGKQNSMEVRSKDKQRDISCPPGVKGSEKDMIGFNQLK